MSYSQIGQDIKVLQFYNYKKNGYYVEIGASNGITFSNTYLLATRYHWKGICVEPLPQQFEKLCKNRPKAICYNQPVYDESNKEVIFDIANNSDMLSGISYNIDCHIDLVNSNKTQLTLTTISLNDLLDKSHAPNFIEYLSLDTEGSEFEILKSNNYDEYNFGLIHLEHNFIEPKRTQMHDFLLDHGYIHMNENMWDDEYVHNSLEHMIQR